MSKFNPGDRVSFLYFGEKRKGTVVGQVPHNPLVYVVRMGCKQGNHEVSVSDSNMKKLRPKPRRECWVVYRKADGLVMTAYDTLQDVNKYVFGLDNNIEAVHIREVRK